MRAWSHSNTAQKLMMSPKTKVLFLDFDGTLAPIAREPSGVYLSREMRGALARVSRNPRVRVVVISGRALADLSARVGIRGIVYMGNHGLEVCGPGVLLHPRAKEARRYSVLIWLLGQRIREEFGWMAGLVVEDKGVTLSIHYRKTSKRDSAFLKKRLQRWRKTYRVWPLTWRTGKMVYEVVPSSVGKGEAALHFFKFYPGALAVAIGDDKTDESMFRALGPRAITIRVGRSRRSSARYFIPSQKDVLPLLRGWSGGVR